MNTKPYWFRDRGNSTYPPLDRNLEVEVLIIGGGITGITAAYLLAREGRKVALVERESLGNRDTGHTTAHLTYMTDTRLSDVVATFSRKEARLAWDAGRTAMDFIKGTVAKHGIDCHLEQVPGYLVAAEQADLSREVPLLQREADIARGLGFEAEFIESCPVTGLPGIRFEDQMKFHPLLYLDALAANARDAGAEIFENTAVTRFADDGGKATAGDYEISYEQVFIATHVPLQGEAGTFGAALFQTKLALYSSYAVGARVPSGELPPMIWSDTGDPFLYLRIEKRDGYDYWILGGEDHKTGQEPDTVDRFARLEEILVSWVPSAMVEDRWSGQVMETVDGLPYIGRTSETQLIATGFSGDGMTFGTAAALLARDLITGVQNPYAGLFDPARRKLGSIATYLSENKDFPACLFSDRFGVKEGDPEQLAAGEAKVLEHDGKRVAAYRDLEGKLTVCSAICPHLGCVVAWNDAERTWDCPCHGSRFRAGGEVIAGPAESDLAPVDA